jgi:CspA family cold shock protein
MQVGEVIYLKFEGGFGFIKPDEGPDIFFHCRDMSPDMAFDETLRYRRVRFDIAPSPKGPRAANIQPAD